MAETASTTPASADARRVVVGVDGSPSSVQALRRAARIAAALNVPLEAICVWQEPFFYGTVADPFVPESGPLVEAAQANLQDAAQRVFGDATPDGYQGTVLHGGAAEVLLTASKGAEMLVVGSRGHGGFAGLLLGSVSGAVAEHASCPVLVFHDDERSRVMVRPPDSESDDREDPVPRVQPPAAA